MIEQDLSPPLFRHYAPNDTASTPLVSGFLSTLVVSVANTLTISLLPTQSTVQPALYLSILLEEATAEAASLSRLAF